jgi:hypothetical protein
MAKHRTTDSAPVLQNSPGKLPPRWRRPGIVQSSIYLPTAMHDALREAAFKERRKMHDIMLEGIQLAIDKRRQKAHR